LIGKQCKLARVRLGLGRTEDRDVKGAPDRAIKKIHLDNGRNQGPQSPSGKPQ
jgi:hypothetical protein